MDRALRLKAWLARRWVAGAGFMAAALLVMVPLLVAVLPLPLLLIFLHSPAYMIHQVEEHTGDRFRSFANARVFGGVEALTVASVVVINVGAVWALNAVALYAALAFGAGYGLIAPYAMLVNAVTHVGVRLRLGIYNPGLVTALAVFLPLSLATVVVIGTMPQTSLAQHLSALGGAVLLHALIVLDVALRLRRLRR